jgi:O-acetyl-ADP-ribose deacetylase (regulator of RNase III)
MGRGIALQFRNAYEDNYKAYVAACKRGDVQPGRMLVFETNKLIGPRYVINFPTKQDWRGKSRLEYIDTGLVALVEEIRQRNIRSIAIPPLGSGLGGLDWQVVRPRITAALAPREEVRVEIYEPSAPQERPDPAPSRKSPNLTPGRTTLVLLMHRYLGGLMDPFVSLLEVHKVNCRLLSVKHLVNAQAEAVEQTRHRSATTLEHAILSVGFALKHQHADRSVKRVDNPVFGDACLGIVKRLLVSIAFRPVWANDFDNQISTKPILILIAWILGILEHQDIWLAKLPRPHLHPQRSEENLAASWPQQQQQHFIQEREDDLMITRRHREHLDHAIGKLNEMVRLAGQFEVLLDTPQTLQRLKGEIEAINRTDDAQVACLGISRHTATLCVSLVSKRSTLPEHSCSDAVVVYPGAPSDATMLIASGVSMFLHAPPAPVGPRTLKPGPACVRVLYCSAQPACCHR